MKSRRDSAVPAPEAGFSLIELMIALLILSIGILGLAGVTAYSIQKVTVADLDTVRGAALQSVVEQLRATPRDSLKDGVDTVGVFDVAWSVVDNGSYSMVEIVTTGASPSWSCSSWRFSVA
jgi:type IV pilus assembly protein PilV